MDRAAEFLGQLARYQPADELERKHHRDLVDLLRHSDAPFSRAQFQPGHVTASLFIVDEAGRLLLHHHRRLGRWLQMGGHLEAEESPMDAAFREGAEESGLRDLRGAGPDLLDVDVHLISAGKGEPEHHHYDVRYLAFTGSPETITIDLAESVELVWMSLEQAEAVMASPESRRVIRKITGVLCAS